MKRVTPTWGTVPGRGTLLRWRSSPYKVQQAKLLSQQRTLTVFIKTLHLSSSIQSVWLGSVRLRLGFGVAGFGPRASLRPIVIKTAPLKYKSRPGSRRVDYGLLLLGVDLVRGAGRPASRSVGLEVPKPYLSLHFPVRRVCGG